MPLYAELYPNSKSKNLETAIPRTLGFTQIAKDSVRVPEPEQKHGKYNFFGRAKMLKIRANTPRAAELRETHRKRPKR